MSSACFFNSKHAFLRGLRLSTLAMAVGVALGAAASSSVAAQKTPSTTVAVSGVVAPLPPGVVAKVNDTPITQSQLDEAAHALNRPETPALRTELINTLVARELFKEAAEKAQYDTNPQVLEAVQQAKTSAMITVFLRNQVKPVPVTDTDVRARYDAIIGSLGKDELQPSAIAVKDPNIAQTIVSQLKKGADFGALAKEYSQGPNAAQGGMVNWVSFKTPLEEGKTQGWPLPLAEALTKLPSGAVSKDPVQNGDVYWILRVDQKRATQIPTYTQTAPAIRQQLERVAVQKATEQVVIGLMKQSHIQE